jgi:hypothetical protein
MLHRRTTVCFFAVVAGMCSTIPAKAQGNYEIQVYGADTVEPKSTMVEPHFKLHPGNDPML